MKVTKTFQDFKNSTIVGDFGGPVKFLKIADFPAGSEIVSVQAVITEAFSNPENNVVLEPVIGTVDISGVVLTNYREFTIFPAPILNDETSPFGKLLALHSLVNPAASESVLIRDSHNTTSTLTQGSVDIYISNIVHLSEPTSEPVSVPEPAPESPPSTEPAPLP